MKTPSAEQLQIWARKISESDHEAFDSFFRSMYPRLVHFALRYIHRKSVASDIVQDAFVKLWERRQQIDPSRSIKAYIYRIVKNNSLNYIRDHSEDIVGLELLNNGQLTSVQDVELHDESDPLSERLKEWIDELPERQKEAFELSRFEGLEHDEIAGVMNISSNTVNNHIVTALKQLRARYELYQQEVKKNSYD